MRMDWFDAVIVTVVLCVGLSLVSFIVTATYLLATGQLR